MSEFGLKAVIDATSAEEGERKLIKSFQAIKKAAEEAAAAIDKVGKGAAAGAASVTQRGMAALGGGGGRGSAGGAPNFGNVGMRTRVERAEAAYLRDQQRNTALVMRAQEGLRQATEETAAAWQTYYEKLYQGSLANKSVADSAKVLERELQAVEKAAEKAAAAAARAAENEERRLARMTGQAQNRADTLRLRAGRLGDTDPSARDNAVAKIDEALARYNETLQEHGTQTAAAIRAQTEFQSVLNAVSVEMQATASSAKAAESELRRVETMIGRAENRAESLRMRSQRMLRDDPARRSSVNASIDEALNNYRETLRSVGSQSTEAVQAQNALNMAFTRISGTISDEGGLLRAMQNSNDLVREMAVRFRQTGQAISVLDGPLGGIASRFRSFGMLINHGGIAIAGMATGLAALIFGLRRAVTEFSNFEARMLAVDAMVERIDSSIGITTEGVEKLVREINAATLGTSDHLREAASQILAFGDNAAREFERTMWLAQDLSSLGFGSVQQAAQRLGRAMEEPEQALNQLRRMNIIFTDSQRDMILALREAGREIEAQGLFLDMLEDKIGGAASQIGSGMAGTLSTLGQATEEFFLELGDTALARGVAEAIGHISEGINWLTRNFDLAVDRALQFGAAIFVLTRLRTIHSIFALVTGAVSTFTTAVSTATARTALLEAATLRLTAAKKALAATMRAINWPSLLLTGLTAAVGLYQAFNIQTRDAAGASLAEAKALNEVGGALRQNNAERAAAAEQRRTDALARQREIAAEIAEVENRINQVTRALDQRILGPDEMIGREISRLLFGTTEPPGMRTVEMLRERMAALSEEFKEWGEVAEGAAEQATEALGAVSERGMSEAARQFRDETIKAIREFNQEPMEALETSAWFRGSSEEVQTEMRGYQRLRDGLEATGDAGRLVTDTLKELRDEAMDPAERAARDYEESLGEMKTALGDIDAGLETHEQNLRSINLAIRDQRIAINLLSGDEEKRGRAMRMLEAMEQQRNNAEAGRAAAMKTRADLEADITDAVENRESIEARLTETYDKRSDAAARTIENLQTELSATSRMNAALLQNEAAVAALNLQLEKEENLRRAGEDATDAEIGRINEMTEALWSQKQAQDAIQAARGMADDFAEESLSSIEQARKPFDDMLERLDQIDTSQFTEMESAALGGLVRQIGEARDAAVARAETEREAAVRQIELDTLRAQGMDRQAEALERLDERQRRYEDLVAEGEASEEARKLADAWYEAASAIESGAIAARAYREETLRSITESNQRPEDRLAQLEASPWFQDADAEAQAFYRSLHEMNEAMMAAQDAGAPLRDVLKEIAEDALSPAERATKEYEENISRLEAAHEGARTGVQGLQEEEARLTAAIKSANKELDEATENTDAHALAVAALQDLESEHRVVSLALRRSRAEEAALEDLLTEARDKGAVILERLIKRYTEQASAAEKLLENLRQEEDAVARMNAALLENEAAVDALNLQLEIEANLRRAGEDATSEQRAEIERLTRSLHAQKRAQDALTGAQSFVDQLAGDSLNALEKAVAPFDELLSSLSEIDTNVFTAEQNATLEQLKQTLQDYRAEAVQAAEEQIDASRRQIELDIMRASGLEVQALAIERLSERQKRYETAVAEGMGEAEARQLANAWHYAVTVLEEATSAARDFREETVRAIREFNQKPLERLEAASWFQNAEEFVKSFYRELQNTADALNESEGAGRSLRDMVKQITDDAMDPAERAMRDFNEGLAELESVQARLASGAAAYTLEIDSLDKAIEAQRDTVRRITGDQARYEAAVATLKDLEDQRTAVIAVLNKVQKEGLSIEEARALLLEHQAEILKRLMASYGSRRDAAADLIDSLRVELDATSRLNAALLQNEAAVDAVNLQLEIEANLRQAGEEATEAQRREIESLTVALWEQKRAQDAIREGQGLVDASRQDGMNALERAVEPFDKVLEDLGNIDLGSLGAGSREAVINLQEQVRAARADALESAMQEQDAVVRQIELDTMRAQGLEHVAVEIERMVDHQKRYEDLVAAGVAPERAQELADAWYDATRAFDENARKVEEFERLFGNSLNTLSSSFGEFITGQKEGFEALGDVAAAVAQDIINEFMRMYAIRPLMDFLSGPVSSMFSGGGGISAVQASAPATIAANPGIFHKGGRAGIDRVPTRPVPAEVFRDAPRYHRGGIAGLRANEVPAILERGERVIPNGATAQGGGNVVINTSVSVNVNGGQGGQTTDTQQAQKVGEEVARQVRTAIAEEIQHLRRPGNMLNPVF